MEEFTQSVKATLNDRAKKPFTGTFILAWIAYNWKILVTIFFIDEEHLKGITRIDYIDKLQLLGINNLVLKPFGIAILALIILGILNVVASWIVLQFQNFQFEYIDKRTKIDSADYGKLLSELKNIKDKWADEIQSINQDRASLMESNSSFKLENDSLIKDNTKLNKDLAKASLELNNRLHTIDSYEIALYKGYELLEKYNSQYGHVKKDRSFGRHRERTKNPFIIKDIITEIDNLHDNFNK